MFPRLLIACLLTLLGWFIASPALALEGIDVTARMQVRVLGPTLQRGTSTAVVLIRNTSGVPVYGPLSLLVTRIDVPGVSLANVSWHAPDGAPLVDVPAVRDIFHPKRSITVTLRFTNPHRVRRFTFGYAIYGFPNPRPSGPPTAVQTVLGAAGTAPGEAIALAWRVTGGKPSRERQLQVRARAPGVARTGAGARWSNPGLSPPNGALFHLTPAGLWQEAPVAYSTLARNGHASLALPSAMEGAWLIEVALVDAVGGDVRALGGRTVVVSREPSVYLRLNPPAAGSLDAVRATLVTTAGATPRAVRLLAWLVRPDGAQVGLPGLAPNDVVLYEGPSRSERIRLLDRVFGADGHGAYAVHARLFDTETGALIARASAGFEVCDAPGTLSGVVRSASGVPLGAEAKVASVQALYADRAAVASATLDASGAYALTLAPGRYLVTATVIDAAGTHRAQSGLVEVGCAGTAATLDLMAAAPTPPLSAASGSGQ